MKIFLNNLKRNLEAKSNSNQDSTNTPKSILAPEPKTIATPITISPDGIIKVAFLAALGVFAAIALIGAFAMTIQILTYLGAALYLAMALEPIVTKFMSFGIARNFAVAIVFIGFIFTISLIFYLMIPAAIDETKRFSDSVPTIISQISNSNIYIDLNNQFQGQLGDLLSEASNFLSNPQQWLMLANGLVVMSATILNSFLGFLLVIILTLYFMVSIDGLVKFSTRIVPASKRDRFSHITNEVRKNVGKFMIAQATLATIHTTFATILIIVLGIKYIAILLPIIFILAIIPIIGPTMAGTLIAVVGLLNSPETSLIVIVVYLIYLQIEGYLISPKIAQKSFSLPGIVVVVAALLGGTVGQVLGVLVAIPAAATITMVVKEIWIPIQDKK